MFNLDSSHKIPIQIEQIDIDKLKPWERNPRLHSQKQIKQIARSFERFGLLHPTLIDENGSILAGHGRVAAAKLLGQTTIPVVRAKHLTKSQKQAFVIADNKIAQNADWDQDVLHQAFQCLADFDVTFDFTIMGFDTPEIDLIIERKDDPGSTAGGANDLPEMEPSAPIVSQPGDLWYLDDHRLLCGDATDGTAFSQLLGHDLAQMVFTDPPYNVAISGHVSGRGTIQHREFPMASGEMSGAEYTAFLGGVLAHLAANSIDGSIHYVCMDWRHVEQLLTAAQPHYKLQNFCVWNKTNGGLGSLYRSKHELVPVFKRGTAAHINNIELGKHGRYRTNVWDYAGTNTFRKGRQEELAAHPTVKPVGLVADAIRDCSHRNGLILDCFGGSGTTIVAAEMTGRRGYAMELDPAYVDVAIRRWQVFTGNVAVHAATGLTFAELTAQRSHRENTEGSDA